MVSFHEYTISYKAKYKKTIEQSLNNTLILYLF